MPDRAIIDHASPTLARLKLGNLFNYTIRGDFDAEFAGLRALLGGKGVALCALRETREKALVCIYRADELEEALRDKAIRRLLKACGYARFDVDGAQFDCAFINSVDQITFDGATISGTLEGNEVFRHEYSYVGPLSLNGMMDGTLYEAADADAGEFRYFYMMPDTPATTYHLEFRYGSDVDALAQYNEGPYAYWLAAGFPADADEAMIKNVITLFCEENLAEMGEETPAA